MTFSGIENAAWRRAQKDAPDWAVEMHRNPVGRDLIVIDRQGRGWLAKVADIKTTSRPNRWGDAVCERTILPVFGPVSLGKMEACISLLDPMQRDLVAHVRTALRAIKAAPLEAAE